MKEGYYYIIKDEFFNKFEKTGSKFKYNKQGNRPTFCCIKDNIIEGLYWAIPTSTGERTMENAERLKDHTDIEGSYYHIGYTSKRAVFCISSSFPIIDKYVKRNFTISGQALQMKKEKMKSQIKDKLLNILTYENQHPNKLEPQITKIKNELIKELGVNTNVTKKGA